ncbi:hypothetical protein GCM10022243_64490 [Saccharothrix violaceirubra]|uniref:DUF397 domain-containing protein n=1 Tax=Saccharothrix violaceirubra TaxID=413306 RepID=A0A7W7WZ32_9PSEU|nr:DUF397 domain-containing protein [Saccharothrix violaceirubra]MBB4969065.1 hypothetical protein [Saccharothrix violaceirubra]
MKRDPELLSATWRKSSRSQNGSANCVELAKLINATAIRDSKNPDGPVLRFNSAAVERFIAVQHDQD